MRIECLVHKHLNIAIEYYNKNCNKEIGVVVDIIFNLNRINSV